MKKKPFAPGARILWCSVLHRLGTATAPPPGAGPGRGRAAPRLARRHFLTEHPAGPRRHGHAGCGTHGACGRGCPAWRLPAPAAGCSIPPRSVLCGKQGEKRRAPSSPSRGSHRPPHSPRTGRGRGLDGADAEPVGRVLQGLQRLLVGLVVVLHGGQAAIGGGSGGRVAAAPGAGQGRRRSVRIVSSAPRRGCAGRAERKSRRGRDGRRAGDSEGGSAPTGEAGSVRPRGPPAPPADRRRLGGQRAGASGAISLPRGLSQPLGAEAGLRLTLFHRLNPIRRSYFCGFPPRACPCLLKNVTAPRVVVCSEEKLAELLSALCFQENQHFSPTHSKRRALPALLI